MLHGFRTVLITVFLLCCLCCLAAAQSPTSWRYDVRPGDRLVYSYTFHREVHGDQADSAVEARFHTQVMIAGVRNGIISAGFQRNRDAAELQTFRVKGKDKLSEERPKFDKRMQARPTQFSEAMEFDTVGEPRYSWEVARESPSHLLPVLHEIEVLPANILKTGERWHAMNFLGMEFEWVGTETVRGKTCYRVKGTTSDGSVTLSYWWSPESGVIERVELEGTYPIAGGTSHEQARMELESRARDESLSEWLGKTKTRLGSLEALLLSPDVPVSAEQLRSLMNGTNSSAERLVLTIARRRGLPLHTPSGTVVQPEVKSAEGGLTTANTAGRATFCPSSLRKKSEPDKFGTLFRVALPEKAGPGIPYLLRIPLSYRADHPTPLLVYLSGGPGLALDGVNTANDVVAGTDYLVLYPQAGEYWWKPEVAERLDAALRDTFKEFNVDPDRVYIAGFSNGGTGALYMAELWPQRFAAAVSLMGAGQCNEAVQQMLPNLANLPLLFVHGDKDPIIAPDCSKVTYDAIAEFRPPVAPQLRTLAGREHDITLTSDDGLTLAFLKDKVRDRFPKRVSARVSDLAFPRQYWLEILDKKSSIADVTAEIKANNHIELRSHDVRKLRLYLWPEVFLQPGPIRIVWNGKQVFEGPLERGCGSDARSDALDPELEPADRKEFALP